MPIKKTSPAARIKKPAAKLLSNKEEDALMEFEQFVSQKPNNNKNKSWLALTLMIIIVLLGVAWFSMSKVETLEKDNNFKVVYLDNGETYYAKVIKEDALNIYLDEVYYIQLEKRTVPAEEEDAEPQVVEVPVLIKRGQELHKPTGLMQINRSKLMAIEEIGSDSEILTEIARLNVVAQ